VLTAGDGTYILQMPRGDHMLQFSKPGYITECRPASYLTTAHR
jgi:hypothetical protein